MKQGKKRVRGNGEGTVYKNSKGTFTAQISLSSGNRPSKTFSTQREANRWLQEMRSKKLSNQDFRGGESSLSSWLKEWMLKYKKRSVSEATYESYEFSLARLTSSLLDKPLVQINGLDIQEALNAIEGTRRTVEITRTFLNMAFKQAVDNRLISDNPVAKTTLPKQDRSKSEPLSRSEQNELEAFCFSLPRILANGEYDKRDLQRQVYKDALLMILQTGISRGECLAIEWTDISFETLEIHVRGTKNESRDRYVFMTNDIVEMLKRRKITARIEFVFETYKGTQLDPHNLWQFMSSKFGHSVHELRHTYITRGAQAGVNPKVLQTLTGHAKVETLLSIYTHVSEEDRVSAAKKIDAYCKPTANPAADSKNP